MSRENDKKTLIDYILYIEEMLDKLDNNYDKDVERDLLVSIDRNKKLNTIHQIVDKKERVKELRAFILENLVELLIDLDVLDIDEYNKAYDEASIKDENANLLTKDFNLLQMLIYENRSEDLVNILNSDDVIGYRASIKDYDYDYYFDYNFITIRHKNEAQVKIIRENDKVDTIYFDYIVENAKSEFKNQTIILNQD